MVEPPQGSWGDGDDPGALVAALRQSEGEGAAGLESAAGDIRHSQQDKHELSAQLEQGSEVAS